MRARKGDRARTAATASPPHPHHRSQRTNITADGARSPDWPNSFPSENAPPPRGRYPSATPAVKPNQKVDKFRAVHSVQFHCQTGSIEMLSVNDLFAVILNLGLRVGSAGFQLNTSVENPV
ncbi:hypothetical protein RE0346_03080 [Prescottella equi]|nr:hypothetical protein RE0346_03080 [Prescottella equi]